MKRESTHHHEQLRTGLTAQPELKKITTFRLDALQLLQRIEVRGDVAGLTFWDAHVRHGVPRHHCLGV